MFDFGKKALREEIEEQKKYIESLEGVVTKQGVINESIANYASSAIDFNKKFSVHTNFLKDWILQKLFNLDNYWQILTTYIVSENGLGITLTPSASNKNPFPRMIYTVVKNDIIVTKLVMSSKDISNDALFVNLFIENMKKNLPYGKNIYLENDLVNVTGLEVSDISMIMTIFYATKNVYQNAVKAIAETCDE